MSAEESMLKCISGIAQKRNLRLNPDSTTVDIVIRGLVKNKEKLGRPYCPCRIRTGNDDMDKNIECPCVYLNNDIEKYGHCKCRLYFKKE